MQCPNCKADNPAGSLFCGKCGGGIPSPEIACPKCRAKNPSGNDFCNTCGARLSSPPSPPPRGEATLVQVPIVTESKAPNAAEAVAAPSAKAENGSSGIFLALGLVGGAIIILAIAAVAMGMLFFGLGSSAPTVASPTATEEVAVEPAPTQESGVAPADAEPTPTKTPAKEKTPAPTTAPADSGGEILNAGQTATQNGQSLTFKKGDVDISALRLSAVFLYKNNSGKTVDLALTPENVETVANNGTKMKGEFSDASFSVPDGGEQEFKVFIVGEGGLQDYVSVSNIVITLRNVGGIEVSKWRYNR